MALLSLEEEKSPEGGGVLDKLNAWLQTPAADAMIASLLDASGPGGGTMGQALGRGLLGGNKLMADAAAQKLQQEEFELKKAQIKKQNDYQKAMLDINQSEFGLKKLEAARKEREEARKEFYWDNSGRMPTEQELDNFIGGEIPEKSDAVPAGKTNTKPKVQAEKTGILSQSNVFTTSPQSDDRYTRAQAAYMRGDEKGANDIMNEDPNAIKKKVYEKTAIEDVNKKREAAAVAPAMLNILDKMEETINKASDYTEMGPIVGKVSPLWSENAQTIQALQGQLVPMLRTVLKFPAAGFSDADREMLEKAAGGVKIDKSVALKIIPILRKYANSALDERIDTEVETFGISRNANDKKSDPLGIR